MHLPLPNTAANLKTLPKHIGYHAGAFIGRFGILTIAIYTSRIGRNPSPISDSMASSKAQSAPLLSIAPLPQTLSSAISPENGWYSTPLPLRSHPCSRSTASDLRPRPRRPSKAGSVQILDDHRTEYFWIAREDSLQALKASRYQRIPDLAGRQGKYLIIAESDSAACCEIPSSISGPSFGTLLSAILAART